MAAAKPFSFGTFECYEGRSSYNIYQAQISNYFEKRPMTIVSLMKNTLLAGKKAIYK